ncbi:MAG: DUF4360 domain-containing protein [Deltaproteobacteria bacterium]|nr:DUF4360 domain-containing protein [Deltaproteobacteria bacterium]
MTISRITSNGTGCPLGTMSANVSADRQALVFAFSEFTAEFGPGISPSAGRKNCVVSIDLTVPAGWQYSLSSASLRGYVDLDTGGRLSLTTTAYFAGSGLSGTFAAARNGPLAQDLVASDPTALSSAGWSTCNAVRAITINTAARASKVSGSSPNATGFFGGDSIDGEVTQSLGLTWRRCP